MSLIQTGYRRACCVCALASPARAAASASRASARRWRRALHSASQAATPSWGCCQCQC